VTSIRVKLSGSGSDVATPHIAACTLQPAILGKPPQSPGSYHDRCSSAIPNAGWSMADRLNSRQPWDRVGRYRTLAGHLAGL